MRRVPVVMRDVSECGERQFGESPPVDLRTHEGFIVWSGGILAVCPYLTHGFAQSQAAFGEMANEAGFEGQLLLPHALDGRRVDRAVEFDSENDVISVAVSLGESIKLVVAIVP